MALSRVKSNGPGHIAIGTPSETSTTSLVQDGRVAVEFHENPRQLAYWVKRLHATFDERSGCRRPAPHKHCNAFLDDDKVTAGVRLNIAIHIVGSRGDVQPFIPIAQLLMKPPYGHRVRICTHPVFKDFVESNGVEFFSIGGDPEALMAYMVKNPGLLPSRESFKAGDIGKRRKEMAEIINGVWRSCIEAGDGMGDRVTAAEVSSTDELFLADAIIANPPSMGHIHCAEKLGIPLHMVFTMPWSPTQTFHHPLASMNYGDTDASVANYLSFTMMELLTWQGLGDVINKFRTKTLKLDPISPMWGHQLLPRLRVPYSYLWSQSLIPRPPDWGSHISITGFSFLNLASTYTPPSDLAEFLEKGPPPVYIGFGSIVVENPGALTKLIFDAVRIAKVRAIVSKGWGGVGADNVPDDVYLIGNCPHDWLFQRVSCVVHHGGAGTTAAGIAAGRPTVVVPFFGDQPFWGQMIARAGAGPSPVPFKKMTAETLAASITFALKPDVQVAVKEMAQQIAEEDGAGDTAKDVDQRLDTDEMRCDLCPERLAIWQHKESGIHMSGFAAACLINAGLMHPHHIKPLRHRHWYVDEGAEHPLIGIVAAVSGLFTSLGTATWDYSQRLKHPPNSRTRRKSVMREPVMQQNANGATITPQQMEIIAWKMADESLKAFERRPLQKAPTSHEKRKARWNDRERGRNGRVFSIIRASGRFAADVTKAGLEAPVAFFYNIANGFHNYPSYGFGGFEVRRRDEIQGVGSGFKTAGKEFVLSFYDAFSGIVVRPYEGAKNEGVKGFGKGIVGAGRGFMYNLGAGKSNGFFFLLHM